MKILIDIGHPAHVHYFKNFIKIMESKGNQFLIISRNKEIEHYLLKQYDIPFIDRGKGQKRLIGKAVYYFKAVCLIYFKAIKFAPDIIMSSGSPYTAFVSKLICKPHHYCPKVNRINSIGCWDSPLVLCGLYLQVPVK